MKGGTPSVSIGMPVYNAAPWLAEALDSLLGQSFADFELIISDNASTDGTEALCRAAAGRDGRVRYDRNEANIGGLENFRRVLDAGRGAYFMWAAGDDVWEKDYVAALRDALERDPGKALAFCAFDSIDGEGRKSREYPHLLELGGESPGALLESYLAQPEHLGKANLIYGLMPRRTLLAAGGFSQWSEREWGMDMLVVFRVLSHGGLALVGRPLFHKRIVEPPAGAGAVAAAEGRARSWRARLARRRGDLLDWKSYFRGYERLIGMAEGLSEEERRGLRRLARERYRRVRTASLREMRRGAAERAARALRQMRSANVLSVRRK